MSSTINSIADPTKDVQAPSDFTMFRLEDVLPSETAVYLHMKAGILTLVDITVSPPLLLAQDSFTFSEMCVLVPLLASHPHYAPYEVLLAHFTNVSTNVTEEVVETCRRHLHKALQAGVFEHEMRPVRNVISRTRLKLHGFGIDVTSLLETGYMLRKRTKKRKGGLPLHRRVSA